MKKKLLVTMLTLAMAGSLMACGSKEGAAPASEAKTEAQTEAPITGIVMRDVYIQNAKQRCVFEDCKDLVLDDVYVDGKEIK